MHHGINLKLRKQRPHCGLVADIAAHEAVAWILLQAGQILDIAGIGQRVEYDNAPFLSICQPMAHEVGTDKTGPTRDEQITRREVHPASSSNYAANAASEYSATRVWPPYPIR